MYLQKKFLLKIYMEKCLADDDFLIKTGLQIASISKKGNLVEYESESKIAHFYPTKIKGIKKKLPKNCFYKTNSRKKF